MIVFLSFGHELTAPSDAFLARFADHRRPVKSYAESKVSPTGESIDRATSKVGALLQVAKVDRKSGSELDVEVALSSLPINSNRFIYTVVYQEGKWVIRGRKPVGIGAGPSE